MGKETNLQYAVLVVDLLLLISLSTVSYFIFQGLLPEAVAHTGWLSTTMTFAISFIISFLFSPAIAQQSMVKSESVVKRVLTTCALFLLFVTIITISIRPGNSYPHIYIFSFTIIFTVALITERLCVRNIIAAARSRKKLRTNVVFIGCDKVIYDLHNIFNIPSVGYSVKGAFFNGESLFKELNGIKLGGKNDVYEWLLKNKGIDEIYCYMPKEERDEINMLSKFCDNHLIRFYYAPAIEVFNGNIAFQQIGSIPVIARRKEPLRSPFNKFVKRAFDIIVSSIFLVTVYPFVFIFVAIMIKLKSPGPIYFKQARTGLDGKEFKCIKFRSMKVNADADKVQATKDDPRKYPFGDFMRKTNIDELPQFINVWKGDMSLVGPRPHMLKHTEEYSRLINRFMVRHFAKPGITGLAQVSGFRGETKYIDQMEGRVRKDIEYIENWTFLLDIKIMIKTVTNMFHGEKNAY